MEPLKDIYASKDIFRQLSKEMKVAYPALDEKSFFKALVKDLDTLEFMARIERAADICQQFLPQDYLKALKVLYRFVDGKENRFIYITFPIFVAKYGQHHYKESIKAIRDFTQYSTSEGGVRTFLELDLDQTLKAMKQWAVSKNTHIRRLSSEGCRPRLPWAKKVQVLIDKPQLTWPILEILKEDPEKYVQKSVANHINDISKDHPDWVVQKIKRWNLKHPVTKWIISHGTRTLIKQGHKGALALSGHHFKPNVKIENVRWNKKVCLGDGCEFLLDIVSKAKKSQPLVIDYQLYFSKSNGELKPKIFKVKKYTLKPNEILPLKIKYTFKDMSTRKHYSGPHMWQLLINGEKMKKYEFQVVP